MATCDPYNYYSYKSSGCPYPNYGDTTTTPTSAATHALPENHTVHFLQNLYSPSHLSVAFAVFVIIVASFSILFLVRKVLCFRAMLRQKMVFLELTPPAVTLKSPLATEQFITILRSLGRRSTWKDRLIGLKSVYAPETVASRRDGIRYVIRLPEAVVATFQQQLAAYLPAIRFKPVDDYLKSVLEQNHGLHLMEFKLLRHYAYRLRVHDSLAQHDPMSYIFNCMTQLAPDELLVYQTVLVPTAPREANSIHSKLILGQDPKLYQRNWWLPFRILLFALRIVIGALSLVLGTIGEMTRPSNQVPRRAYDQPAPKPLPTPAAQAVTASQIDKLKQPLFQVSIRALVISPDAQRAQQRLEGIRSALASFDDPGYQGLIPKRRFPNKLLFPYRLFHLRHRLPAPLLKHSCVLSVSEVAGLYHFPYGDSAKAENTVQSYAKTLPAPIALKQHADDTDFDVILGINQHHGSTAPIGLTTAERERHVYIIGGTGNGKTTLLEYGIVQDIAAGKGVAIIDPHGDSAQKLLGYIPKDRLKDVIYLNPRDLDYPIGLNILEVPEGLTGSDLAHERDLVAEAIISVFRKIFDDNTDGSAHRIERVLRNAIHTAFYVEDATLFTVLRLLTDASYRKQVTRNLPDESLKRFWKEELGKAGEMQRVKISSGPITRIERFERSEAAKRILGQIKSTIDFDDIMNSSKILICNFSKGRLGEDTSTLFGTTVLAKLQLAAWRRDDIAESERVPFYLYVDEFQNFASDSFMGLFSEARKYKLLLTMAQQSVGQLQDQSMITTILDNVGTIIAFRSKSPETEQLLLHQFSPQIDPGEIGKLPSFNFYMNIGAVDPQEPLSGMTLLLEGTRSERMAQKVIASSRKRYAIKYIAEEEAAKPNTTAEIREQRETLGSKPVEPSDDLGGLPGLDKPIEA